MREDSGDAIVPRSIGQIAVPVKDPERATTFYRDVLGLTHLFSAPPGLSFFRCGEVRLMLSAPEADDETPAEAGGADGTLLYYRVDDLDAMHRRLVAAGTVVLAEPHVVHRGAGAQLWMGFYRDSEGNRFATMAELAVAEEAP